MKTLHRVVCILFILIFTTTALAYADLPDLPKQELSIKIVSLLVGLVIIISLSILGLNKIMYNVLGMEAEMSTKLSIILAVVLSFLWFLYIFGQIFETTIKIALGVLLFICVVVYFLRDKPEMNDDYDDDLLD